MNLAWRKCEDMDEATWLQWRRSGIGGSDAPAIMGVSPWTTPYQKWEEKIFNVQKQQTSAMKFGKDSEVNSRAEFSSLMGKRFMPVNVENTQETWLKASLDGIDENGEDIVEIKKASKADHETALKGKVPEKYWPQVQHILQVTGKDKMYYFSSPHDGSTGKVVEVVRDCEYIEKDLHGKELAFWGNVLTRIPPEFTDRDFQDMNKNKQWVEIATRWKGAKSLLDKIGELESSLREELISLSTNRNACCEGVKLSKSIVQGRIDYVEAFNSYINNLKLQYPDIEMPPLLLDTFRKDPYVKWSLRAMD